jgi:D-psicose/D-tagatose/L-ribulose 3-epimerase
VSGSRSSRSTVRDYFLNIASDAAALCEAIGDPNVGILLDTFHCNIEEKSIGAALKAAGRH